jgi:hypothetical protein
MMHPSLGYFVIMRSRREVRQSRFLYPMAAPMGKVARGPGYFQAVSALCHEKRPLRAVFQLVFAGDSEFGKSRSKTVPRMV